MERGLWVSRVGERRDGAKRRVYGEGSTPAATGATNFRSRILSRTMGRPLAVYGRISHVRVSYRRRTTTHGNLNPGFTAGGLTACVNCLDSNGPPTLGSLPGHPASGAPLCTKPYKLCPPLRRNRSWVKHSPRVYPPVQGLGRAQTPRTSLRPKGLWWPLRVRGSWPYPIVDGRPGTTVVSTKPLSSTPAPRPL